MSILPWEQTYTIRSYEVDETNRARLSTLWDILQDIASIHANSLGMNYHALNENGYFWLLCRMQLDIFKYPKMGDKIKVITIPRGIDKIFAIRDYEVYDINDNLIAKSRSCWVIANTKTLKPERVNIHVPELNMPVSGEIPGKIKIDGEFINSYGKIVEYSDIDVNRHVNNGRYIHWIEDVMDNNNLEPHPTSIQVNFIAEEKKGAIININLYKQDEKFYFDMRNKNDKLILQVKGKK